MTAQDVTVLDSYKPKLVKVEDNLTAAAFRFMKIFPAAFCLRRVQEEGWTETQPLIMQTSSCNMALGAAMICNLHGFPLTIISDSVCGDLLRIRLEGLNATLITLAEPGVGSECQKTRIDQIEEVRARIPNHWWVNLSDHPGNPGAYGFFAAQLIEELGQIDYLVGAVGSGGSVCGTAGFLRELFPEMLAVGVDTFGSVLFGQPRQTRRLRGIGSAVLPQNLDHSLFDEVHWVTAAEAYKATRRLYQKTFLFCGETSGAAWLVASYLARKNSKARVVCILPDDGELYRGTVYNDQYLRRENLWLAHLPEAPREVAFPADAGPGWSFMHWGRREYAEVIRCENPL
jgi:cysteine synthase A